jgi:hypothetical protein
MKKWALVSAMVMITFAAMTGIARSDMGLVLNYNGSFEDNFGLNIRNSSGLDFRILAGFTSVDGGDEDEEGSMAAGANSIYSLGGTQIRLGAEVIKEMMGNADVNPHIGARARFHLNSPDAENYDSFNDILFGALIGAGWNATDNFSIDGNIGFDVMMYGEQTVGDFVVQESLTDFGTSVWLSFVYNGLWGGK